MTDPGRWETITGSAHTVRPSAEDYARYPALVPGDVVLDLEATTAQGEPVGIRIALTAQALKHATFNLYATALDRMTRDLDRFAPIR